jgi:hypothetical protein
VEERGQALGVELVGLVDVAHHDLGFGGVGQERQAACGLNPIGDPVSIADAFQGDGSAFGELLQEGLDGARLVVHPGLLAESAMPIQNRELTTAAMGVATDPIMGYGCTSFSCVVSRHKCSRRCKAFI